MKHHIKIAPAKRKNSSQNLTIRIRVSYDNHRLDLSSGYSISLDKWDINSSRVKKGCYNTQGLAFNDINKGLNEQENIIHEYFIKCSLDKNTPNEGELKKYLKSKYENPNQTSNIDFVEKLDEFIRTESSMKSWAEGTVKKIRTLKKNIVLFDEKPTFENITIDWLERYMEFLKKERNNLTVQKEIRNLKWFLRWARKKGYNTRQEFSDFIPKLKTYNKQVIFLKKEELMYMYNYNFEKDYKYLEPIRDAFCFCCFTSLRYSDLFNLKKSNIKDDYIEITTIKTDDNLKIELNKYAKEILDKYKNFPKKGTKALPVISNQKMNFHLKTIGELCKLNDEISIPSYKGKKREDITYKKYELLTTHCGRRTFICLALEMDISPIVVMEWTGHSDYQAMKPYIKITDTQKSKAMSKFNKLK